MNETENTERHIIYGATAVLIVLIATIGGCLANDARLAADALKAGADPASVACLYASDPRVPCALIGRK